MPTSKTIGLQLTSENRGSIMVWAPLAISLKINANGIAGTLLNNGFGFWELKDFAITHGDLYSLTVDGRMVPDPASLFQPSGVEGISQAFDVNKFQWTDQGWQGIPLEKLIIYELHTGCFTREGTFDSLSSKIEHLKNLGINAIELMPVAQFSGSRNWGYDGVFPFAVQNSYGGPGGLQRLVDLCHNNGLAVILDVVYNHLGPEGNVLPLFGPFFTDKYKTPWGMAINYDDAWCDGVRQYYIQNVLMWLRDFHIDGLRLDAIHAIKDFSPKHILREMQEQVLLLNRKSLINHFLIGESDLNDTKYIDAFENGGYGLDITWCDEFHHALHALVTSERQGYYGDFGNLAHLVKAFNEGFVFNGIWSEHRKKTFGTNTTGFPGQKFIVFAQNHDQTGNRMHGDRLSLLVDAEVLKMIAGAFFFSPFIPMLFMGEEYAEKQPFLYFTSHSNNDLVQQVREGRKKEFKSFIKEGEFSDPQDEGTYHQSKLQWDGWTDSQHKIFNFYKELIRLRKTNPLWNTDRGNFSAKAYEGKDVLILTRKRENQSLMAVFNFEEDAVPVITCETRIDWQIIMNSCDLQWGGPGNTIDTKNPSVLVPAHSFVVLYSH